MIHPLRTLRGLGFVALGGLIAFGAPSPAQERDTTVILEEQELLRRQLQRLKRTMEALIPRLEREGRPRALELLREGLTLLEERGDGTGQLTIDELMERARTDVQAGQVATSIQRQEQIIQHLDRLLSVLLDRTNVETLEKSLLELKEIRKGIEDLSARESELQKETEKLREKSATDAQRALEQKLAELRAAQRSLLEKNESAGRSSGAATLEQIERELAELVERQSVDSAVLQSWSPDVAKKLDAAAKALAAARAAAERAALAQQAADQLRDAARQTRAQADPSAPSPAGELDKAAEREDRRFRASGDEGAERNAEALKQAAEALRNAGATANEREHAAQAAERSAEELERSAAAQRAAARAARENAAQLAKGAQRSSQPTPPSDPTQSDPTQSGQPQSGQTQQQGQPDQGQTGQPKAGPDTQETPQTPQAARASKSTSPSLDEALERAARATDPEEASRATQEAAQTLQRELEDQTRLGPALSAAQNDAAETAERLARGLESLPAPKPDGEATAREALQRAAEAMKAAASEAHNRDPEQAAAKAQQAESALKEAQAALAGARSQRAQEQSPAAQSAQSSLAAEQAQLAQQATSTRSQSQTGSMSQSAQEQVEKSLEDAQAAMEQAAQEMSEGRSSSAAQSQRDALDALDRAQQAAESGVRPTKPEDQAKADELAGEQEAIRKELLELATRNKARKNSKPNPSLDSAGSKAGEAKKSLDEGELSEAGEQAEEVQRDLAKALDELEKEEDQYQRLRQEELLFKIAEEVEALLKAETEALGQIREIDGSRAEDDKLSRADRLRLRRVGGELTQVAARATEIASAIEQERAVVFSHILREVRQDLERVARDIDEAGGNQTGERVQALLEDSLETTQWLLDALKAEQRRRQDEQQQGQQQQQQDEQRQALVPDVAELKLLRQMEVDTIGALDRLMLVYPDLETADLEPEVLEDILRLAERHERTTRLFKQFRQRLGIDGPEDKP